MNEYIFKSKRLGFRNWIDSDLIPFSKMNCDPAVMEFFPKTLTQEETKKFIERIKEHFIQNGFGLYAVDKLLNNEFIGFIGFMKQNFESDFTPCIEIGWRISAENWNNGYATEGAKRCLEFGFKSLELTEIYSFTSKINIKSEKIMKKIGMKKTGEFDHPKIEKKSQLKLHILYNINNTCGNKV